MELFRLYPVPFWSLPISLFGDLIVTMLQPQIHFRYPYVTILAGSTSLDYRMTRFSPMDRQKWMPTHLRWVMYHVAPTGRKLTATEI